MYRFTLTPFTNLLVVEVFELQGGTIDWDALPLKDQVKQGTRQSSHKRRRASKSSR